MNVQLERVLGRYRFHREFWKSRVVCLPPEKSDWMKTTTWSGEDFCKHIDAYLNNTWNGDYKTWKSHRDAMVANRTVDLRPKGWV